jgi:hypothetical protein
MMGAFGRFLELAVPSGDILRSLGFYRALGFSELGTGDIRRWHYAVVSDGRVAIGLHAGDIAEPTLAFVRPNLERQVRALELSGHVFEWQRLGSEEFHEAGLRGPGGHCLRMMEARTFSPSIEEATHGSVIGYCTEVTLACAALEPTRGFFEAAGFLAAPETSGDAVRLDAPGLPLGLRTAPHSAPVVLRFSAVDPQRRLRELAARDLEPVLRPEGQVLIAPEGTRLVLESRPS